MNSIKYNKWDSLSDWLKMSQWCRCEAIGAGHSSFSMEFGLLQFIFSICACGMSSSSLWGLLIHLLPQSCGRRLMMLSEARRCCSLEQLLSLNFAWWDSFYHWQSISWNCICGFKSQKATGCHVPFSCVNSYFQLFSLWRIDRRLLGSSSFILDNPSILKGFC